MRNRYYDPSLGSFITEDPAFDGVNWYSYCGGNPVKYVDPSGLKPGDLQVNGKNIDNTQIINDETYGSLRDFVSAVGGKTDKGNGGIYTVKLGTCVFSIDINSFDNNQMQMKSVEYGDRPLFTPRKKLDLNYTKIDMGNGYSEIIVNIQDMVDLTDGKIGINLAYDLGDIGGTYCYNSISRSVNSRIIPLELAAGQYFSTAITDSFSETLNSDLYDICGSVISGIITKSIDEMYYKSKLNSGNKFMIITENRIFLKSDSWYSVSNSNYFHISAGVGTFRYGEY